MLSVIGKHLHSASQTGGDGRLKGSLNTVSVVRTQLGMTNIVSAMTMCDRSYHDCLSPFHGENTYNGAFLYNTCASLFTGGKHSLLIYTFMFCIWEEGGERGERLRERGGEEGGERRGEEWRERGGEEGGETR